MPDSFDYTTGTNSENVRLLQALIDDAPEYTEETNSRNANILKSIINNTEYTDAPQSEIEELLLRLKAKIGGEIEVDELNVTENGTYDAGVNKAYNPVKVELPLDSKTITENGTYTASDDNLAGFDEVTVAVEGYAKKSIENTPTAIATFNASALPMPSLTVGIEATQDLHGYDNPWPAGGGKNKMPLIALSTQTKNGITFTPVYNGDSLVRIDVKGKKTTWGSIWYGLSNATINISQNMIMNGAQSGSNVRLAAFRVSAGSGDYVDAGNGVEIPTSAEQIVEIDIRVDGNDDTQIDTSVYPMLRYSTIADDSYLPYSNICPIVGKSAVNVYRNGKNLFNIDGEHTTSGATYLYNLKVKPNTTYTMSSNVPQEDVASLYFNGGSTNINGVWEGQPRTFTSDTDGNVIAYVRFYASSQGGIDLYTAVKNGTYYIQLEEGQTATSYEAFGTTYTTVLKDGQGNPLVCYGGQLENENGVQSLTNAKGYVDMGTLNWRKDSAELYVSTEALPVPYRGADGLCEVFKVVGEMAFSNMPVNSLQILTNAIWVKSGVEYTDSEAFKTAMNGKLLTYELATPQQIPQDNLAISTQDGTNNLWADCGDVQSGEYLEAL
jgi:hypothetical protein